MKKLKINMSDIGFGANRLGIFHGYTILQNKYPHLASNINYIEHKLMIEDFSLTNKKFYNSVFNACETIYNEQLKAYLNNEFPILIGGDHSLALGSIKASLEHYNNDKLGLIWIDAHTDINTFKTTDTGNIHGMPVAGLLGLNDERYNNLGNDIRIKPENLVYFATRSIDYGEAVAVEKNDILNQTDWKIKAKSLDYCIDEAIKHLKGKVSHLHISLDLDSMNPEIIKGVSTPVTGGLTTAEPLKIIKRLQEHFEIVSIDVVEYNPVTDIDGKTIDYIDSFISEITKL
jgi:arginase